MKVHSGQLQGLGSPTSLAAMNVPLPRPCGLDRGVNGGSSAAARLLQQPLGLALLVPVVCEALLGLDELGLEPRDIPLCLIDPFRCIGGSPGISVTGLVRIHPIRLLELRDQRVLGTIGGKVALRHVCQMHDLRIGDVVWERGGRFRVAHP